MSETLRFVNPTDKPVDLKACGLGIVGPNEAIDIPSSLCAAGRKDNGSRKKSPIELLAPQLRPINPEEHEAWKLTPAPPEVKSRIVTLAPRARPEPPGVAAIRAVKAAALETAAKATGEADRKPPVKQNTKPVVTKAPDAGPPGETK